MKKRSKEINISSIRWGGVLGFLKKLTARFQFYLGHSKAKLVEPKTNASTKAAAKAWNTRKSSWKAKSIIHI